MFDFLKSKKSTKGGTPKASLAAGVSNTAGASNTGGAANTTAATNPATTAATNATNTSSLLNKNSKPVKKGWKKQIPTLLGIGVLIVALVSGLLFFGEGTGVFAPRATPQTTPKNIKLTNVSDTGFTVSFLTDEATVGFVKYGTAVGQLKSQASDDRDQLTGTVNKFTLHHVTVRGLNPATTYYYALGTGSRSDYDNNGSPFTTATAARSGAPSAARTVYGSVSTAAGNPADGSVVYISIPGIGDMSSLVKNSGSWAVPLSNARTADGSQYATIQDDDSMSILVQGTSLSLTSQVNVLVSDSQPVASITLGQNTVTVLPPVDLETEGTEPSTTEESTSSAETIDPSPSATPTVTAGGLTELLTAAQEATSSSTAVTLDLNSQDASPTVQTTQPTIIGTAAPNVTVTITINSSHLITQNVIADANGNFVLDVAALQETLEPGEHTVTFTYTDPTTGQEVTKTQTFFVEDNGGEQLAQAGTSGASGSEPFGSGNPFSLDDDDPATGAATSSGRTTLPATGAAVPLSGSVGTTYALILGGLFFIIAGIWSYWIAQRLDEVRV